MRLKEISKVISVGVEGKKFSKRRRHDVLVLIFWLGALEFKILKYLFVCCLNIFLDNFPRFSVHKSLKILDKYIANFFNQCYGQNLAAVSTNVREFVSGPILVVAVREMRTAKSGPDLRLQISWLEGCNDKYTVQRIRISWTTVLINKQPKCQCRVQ